MESVKGGMLASVPESVMLEMKANDASASPASYAIRFAASLDGVMVVLSGMSSMEQMRDNLSFMADFRPLNDTELAAIARVQAIFRGKHLIPCTSCRYCTDGCPRRYASIILSFQTPSLHPPAACGWADAAGRRARICRT